jgi:hypothetical protein
MCEATRLPVRDPLGKESADSSNESRQPIRRNECNHGLSVCLRFFPLPVPRLLSLHAQSAGLLILVNSR